MMLSYAAEIKGSRASGEAKVVARAMLMASVAFVEALSAFLFSFYSELTNDKKQDQGTVAWSLVCSIDRSAKFVNFKRGVK